MSELELTGLRCLIIGDEPLAAQCAETARDTGLDIVAIASTHPAVLQYGESLGLPAVRSDGDLVTSLAEIDFDILLSIANLRIVADELLRRAEVAINFHDGPLPDYAGLNVTSWALLDGVTDHAVTWHLMTGDVDAGDIVTSESFAVEADDTAFALNARCYEAALASFPRVARTLASGVVVATPQPDRDRRVFRRRDRPPRIVDLSTMAAEDLALLTRSLDVGHLSTNAIGVPILLLGEVAHIVTSAATRPGASTAGQIVAVDGARLQLGTCDGLVDVELASLDGTTIDLPATLDATGLTVGSIIEPPDAKRIAEFAEFDSVAAAHERFWRRRLANDHPSQLGVPTSDDENSTEATWQSIELATSDLEANAVVARSALWMARSAGRDHAVFDFTDHDLSSTLDALGPLARPPRARIAIDDATTLDRLRLDLDDELESIRRRGPYPTDLITRDPAIDAERVTEVVRVSVDPPRESMSSCDATIVIAVSTAKQEVELWWRRDVVDDATGQRLADQLRVVLAAVDADVVGDIEILTPSEIQTLEELNDTFVERDRSATVDGGIWEQAAATADSSAVSFGGTTWSYRELIHASERFANQLRSAGVGRGDHVGIALPRGFDMLVSVLATLRVGAAYIPLDPTYPLDRLEYMVDDAGLAALVVRGPLADSLARPGIVTLDPATEPNETFDAAASDADPVVVEHDPDDLAYVIYTSGSTGKPKGVMLRHDNVVNFFAAMDEVIDHDPPGVWLAVTSLSFDISVLELLWTLARGFHVVIKPESGFQIASIGADEVATNGTIGARAARRDVSMSLFYFAAGEANHGDGYRLLLDGARFADEHGFEAVWTPERHFHAFGGAYPNPSVVSAALAAVTERVAIRAGSVVLPLHSPVRVAEEWAVVDNLSGGRVGISFAPGWQPNDFVLNPARYGRAKAELPGLIETVHKLWRGDTVELEGHDGAPVQVSTLPRPIQPSLPTWLTSAGTPATFEQAGRLGTNVLTHLLGQSTDELAANINRYRQAWSDAGHAGEGQVTLMMHTHLDVDPDSAKERARAPMKAYLGTAVGLIKNMASSFPTFAGSGKDADEAFESLTPDELDQLLEMAADRYLETSGLFGTPEQAADTVTAMADLGVDEVACLIDFGLETDDVIASFPLLAQTKELIDARASAAGDDQVAITSLPARDAHDETVAALVAEHDVTHFQCTPSLAAMLCADPADRAAVGSIAHVMLGGEALPVGLASDLRSLLSGRFTNMYGPTETTIWSLVHEIDRVDSTSVPIGRPIANNTVEVLDPQGHRRPIGAFGELHIGGQGVARGYHEREALTSERFAEQPPAGRMYATGDIVRIRQDGEVEFAGRSDNQLKIRGHRIELGEIETTLDRHPSVVQSVVLARGIDSDPTLVAFVINDAGRQVDAEELRRHVGETLPPVMVPATFVMVPSFPLTPNGKVDRNAFPTEVASVRSEGSPVAPHDEGERLIAEIWADALGRSVGRDDNFFEIGGHSLLAVGVFRTLSGRTDAPLALTDLFRYPTVRTLAKHIANGSGDGGPTPESAAPSTAGSARGERRRRAMARRGG